MSVGLVFRYITQKGGVDPATLLNRYCTEGRIRQDEVRRSPKIQAAIDAEVVRFEFLLKERLKARGAVLAKQYHDECRAYLVRRIEEAIVAWQTEWEDVRNTEYLADALRRAMNDCRPGEVIQITQSLRLG